MLFRWLITASLLALSASGQVTRIVIEPMDAGTAKVNLGITRHTVWTEYIFAAPGTTSVQRQDVTALTPISELTYIASLDLLGKAEKVSGPRLGGLALDILIPAAGAGLTALGLKSGSTWAITSGTGINFAGAIRSLATGVAPNLALYTPNLLPAEKIPCENGGCGNGWLVLTEKLALPTRMEIPAPQPLITQNAIKGSMPKLKLDAVTPFVGTTEPGYCDQVPTPCYTTEQIIAIINALHQEAAAKTSWNNPERGY